MIKISFSDRRLQKTCSDDRDGAKRWGINWKVVKRRIASLAAAETLADMSNAPGRCHALTADRNGQFALHLWEPYRLVFEPADLVTVTDDDGSIDRSRVTTIRILEIVNYHDS